MNEEQKKKKMEISKNKDIERAIKRSQFYKMQLDRSELNLASKKIKKNRNFQIAIDSDRVFMDDNNMEIDKRSESMN